MKEVKTRHDSLRVNGRDGGRNIRKSEITASKDHGTLNTLPVRGSRSFSQFEVLVRLFRIENSHNSLFLSQSWKYRI